MNSLEDLNLHVEALLSAMESDKKFFAPIAHYVRELKRLVNLQRGEATKAAFTAPTERIKKFWDGYKPSPGGGFYIPPAQTSNTEATVDEIVALIGSLVALPDEQFSHCSRDSERSILAAPNGPLGFLPNRPDVVFVGHGRSKLWARVKILLETELHLKTVGFESESRVGLSVVPILKKMLDEATFAILILTGEDETAGGSLRARQNVIHEAGLFQGRLGFERVVLLKQAGVEDLSNLAGLQYIQFSGDDIEQTFYELHRVLSREKLL